MNRANTLEKALTLANQRNQVMYVTHMSGRNLDYVPAHDHYWIILGHYELAKLSDVYTVVPSSYIGRDSRHS